MPPSESRFSWSSMSPPTQAMSRRPVSAGNCGSEQFWLQTPPGVTDAHCGRSAQPCAHLVRLICSTYLGASGDGCVGHGGGSGSGLATAEAIASMPTVDASIRRLRCRRWAMGLRQLANGSWAKVIEVFYAC
jgi:hypothetical protein